MRMVDIVCGMRRKNQAVRIYRMTPNRSYFRENGCLLTQDVEAKTGLQKSMEIRLVGNAPQVVITHCLSNHRLWPVTCTPWALTQLKPGGMAILPQGSEDTGVLPNRSIVLWPYTNMADPNVQWGRRYIILNANMATPFKVDSPTRALACLWLNGTLFVKRAKYEAQSAYFDFGSSSECYCNGRFMNWKPWPPFPPSTLVILSRMWRHGNCMPALIVRAMKRMCRLSLKTGVGVVLLYQYCFMETAC